MERLPLRGTESVPALPPWISMQTAFSKSGLHNRRGATLMISKQCHSRLSRRKFLRDTGISAVTLSAAPSLLAAGTPPVGPRASRNPVRIGVVGGGFGSHFQWHLHPDCKVTAVCDVRADRLGRLRQVYGCEKGYRDYKEFLKQPGLDAIALFTPAPLHAAMGI